MDNVAPWMAHLVVDADKMAVVDRMNDDWVEVDADGR